MKLKLAHVKIYLQLLAGAHILGGFLLPILVDTFVFDTYNEIIFRALGVEGTGQKSNLIFLHGILGPTIASWGILFLYAVTTAFEKPDKRGWWTILFACLAWAPLDGFLSMQKGIYINGLIDLVVLVAILGPLFMTRKHFFSSPSPAA